MKKLYAIALCLLVVSNFAQAQEFNTWNNRYTALDIGKNNIIKLNLYSLRYSGISVGYERLQQRRRSYNLNLRWTIPSKIPGASKVQKQFSNIDPEVGSNDGPFGFLFNARFGGFGLSGERRFYFSSKLPGRGLYIGPTATVSTHGLRTSLSGTFRLEPRDYSINIKGRTFSAGAGFVSGLHIPLGKTWSLDWGGSIMFGYHTLGLQAKSYDFGFTASQLSEINTTLSDLKKLTGDAVKISVNNSLIKFDAGIPYPMFRSWVSLGYRFLDDKVYRY